MAKSYEYRSEMMGAVPHPSLSLGQIDIMIDICQYANASFEEAREYMTLVCEAEDLMGEDKHLAHRESLVLLFMMVRRS